MLGRGVANLFCAIFLGSSGASPSGWSTGPWTVRHFSQMSSINSGMQSQALGLGMGTGVHCFVRLLYCALYLIKPFTDQKSKYASPLWNTHRSDPQVNYILYLKLSICSIKFKLISAFEPYFRQILTQFTHCRTIFLADVLIHTFWAQRFSFKQNVIHTSLCQACKQMYTQKL